MIDPMNPEIPVVAEYRGVGIHGYQTPERIRKFVKPAIDRVFTIEDPDALWVYLLSAVNPPEARIWAAARLTGEIERRADKRLPLLEFTAAKVRAAVAGLASHWADPDRYCALLDHDENAAPRPPEYGKAMREYFKKIEHDRLEAAVWKKPKPSTPPGDEAAE